jgi:hypothetical protein
MEDLIMKKLIMFVMVLAIATPAMALEYPDVAPDFTGCDNSAWVVWEFLTDDCNPSSEDYSPPYAYSPEPVDPITFGSRHWDDPTDDAGWGGSYDEDLWTYSDGKYSVEAEDSFNQSIPHRGGKAFLRQYFQVVHTMPEGADPCELGLIGLGLELWDMSVYEEEGWTGCPVGYEGLAGDGYIGGDNYKAPDKDLSVDHGNGWHTSVWVTDFWQDTECTTKYAAVDSIDLDAATHAVCIIGMDLDRPAQIYQIEEIILDFIWFDEVDGSDIPTQCCICRDGGEPVVIVEPNDIPVYEPQDTGGPPPMGPTDGQLQISLAWRPGEDPCYPNDPGHYAPEFTVTVLIDPDPNNEHVGNSDFSFTKPVPPDPNGNVTLTFDETNWDVYQNVVVEATADLLREGTESSSVKFTVTIDIDDPNFGSDPCEPVTRTYSIAVGDNDIPYISVLPFGQLMDIFTENDPGVERCVNVTLSHKPCPDPCNPETCYEVEVRAEATSEFEIILEQFIMDPNFEDWTDPNHLLFNKDNYNVNQQVCFKVLDDEEHPDTDLEWIPGTVLFNGISDDIRYQSVDEDGELEPTGVNFNIQDNDCGAWGYDILDINEDCYVGIEDAATLFGQWLFCTDPYDDDGMCDKVWNLVEEE